jgi:hypothetical protein
LPATPTDTNGHNGNGHNGNGHNRHDINGHDMDGLDDGQLDISAQFDEEQRSVCAIPPAENRLVPIIIRDDHSPWDGRRLGLAKPSRSHYVPGGVARRGGPPLTSLNPDP